MEGIAPRFFRAEPLDRLLRKLFRRSLDSSRSFSLTSTLSPAPVFAGSALTSGQCSIFDPVALLPCS